MQHRIPSLTCVNFKDQKSGFCQRNNFLSKQFFYVFYIWGTSLENIGHGDNDMSSICSVFHLVNATLLFSCYYLVENSFLHIYLEFKAPLGLLVEISSFEVLINFGKETLALKEL